MKAPHIWLPRWWRDRRRSGLSPVSSPVHSVQGEVTILLDGQFAFRTTNLFVNVGYGRQAAFLAQLDPEPPQYIAVGNGDGTADGTPITPDPDDTELGFELLRKIITSASTPTTYQSRLVAVFAPNDVQRTITEVALFDTAGENGTASSGGANTLTDSTKAWTTNQWAGWKVYITSGTGSGQSRTISSNTSTQLTVSSNWTTQPDSTSTYTIGGVAIGRHMYARASVNVTKGAQTMNVIWTLNQTPS